MSAIDVERDALAYLEALYDGRPEGSLIVITQKVDTRWPSHFVHSPRDALPYVIGHVDVYARVTPLRKRPDRGRRGGAELAAALQGVWADIDVTGSPNGKGGSVVGGAATLDAAKELAHAVLEPTLT